MQSIQFRRPEEVFKASGYKKSAYYNQVKDGLQLPMVPLGGHAVGIPIHEQDAVNAARLAGKTDDEVRVLVAAIVASRKRAAIGMPFRSDSTSACKPDEAVNLQDPLKGRNGGLKGGKSRMAALTADQRRELARQGAAARWAKGPNKE